MNTSLLLCLFLSGVAVTKSGSTTPGSRRTTDLDTEQVGQPLVHRGNVALPSSVPWHAGIWKREGQVYEPLCGGTLIAPNLIVTAAHCFWNLTTEEAIPQETLRTYKVALGKIYRSWPLDDNNPLVQRFNIERVLLEPGFDGFQKRQLEYDIALVELTTNATMTSYVQVATVDYTAANPPNGSVGVVAGWGYSEDDDFSHELRSIELPYVDHQTCYESLGDARFMRLLKRDKFCAGFTNQGKSVCQGDSGGGFVTVDKVTKMATVRGIVSLDFRPAGFPKYKCYALHYTGFTNIGDQRFRDWIQNHRSVDPPKNCPAVSTSTAVQSVDCVMDGDAVDCSLPMTPGTTAFVFCSSGYTAENRNSKTATCRRDGTWTKENIQCGVPCRAIETGEGVANITCTKDGKLVRCTGSVSPNTVADYTCSNGNTTSLTSTCLNHGSWSDGGVFCPECGRVRDIVTVDLHGERVEDGLMPWNIIVYKLFSSLKSAWFGINCVGTLISPTHVITAASRVSGVPLDELQLAAGKLNHNLYKSEPNSQQQRVKQVILHNQFNSGNRINDIAILVADSSFSLSTKVNVACVDWSGLITPTSSDIFIVAAQKLGRVNRGLEFSTSQNYELVDQDTCEAESESDNNKYLTVDKFCAKTSDNKTCGEPWGGGLVLRHSTQHGYKRYLWGVKSAEIVISNTCGSQYNYRRINAYTDIRPHIGWLRQNTVIGS